MRSLTSPLTLTFSLSSTLLLAGLPATAFAGDGLSQDPTEESAEEEEPADEAPEEAAEPAAEPEGPAAPAQQRLVPPPPKGVGMIVGGAIWAGLAGIPLSALGGLTISAGVATRKASEFVDPVTGASSFVDGAGKVAITTGAVVLSLGLIGVLGGGALIAVGAINNSKYKKWRREYGTQQVAFTPMIGRTAYKTPTYGFGLRF